MSALYQRPVRIREIRSGDLDAVVEIENRGYAFPWKETVFGCCLTGGYDFLVIELDGRIIGYGIMFLRDKTYHLRNICIDPAFQGLGYGSLLFDALLEMAACSAANRVVLEVRPSNVVALEMYKKRGFKKVGVCQGYYQSFGRREDALMLMLMVDSSPSDLAAFA